MPHPWQGFAWGRQSYVAGILNVTPDSFSDGGDFADPLAAVARAEQLAAEGAHLIDIGAESTRPGAVPVGADEEWQRLEPVLAALHRRGDLPPVSLDTTKAEIAARALERGWTRIINDVHGLHGDPAMADVCARYDAGIIVMYNARVVPPAADLLASVRQFLGDAVERAMAAGVPRTHLVVDPGIGFGLRPEQSLELLQRLGELCDLGLPIMLGASRKSFMGHLLGLAVDQRDAATVASTVAGIQQGADLLRVHEVAPNVQAARLADLLYR